ncbi:MAG: helix-turn-helix transcriptional regulator [Rikenellaceae bacterium]|nr:helix-turn-helix transcriptional regulator [Rikenellaceae bacterium]
MGKQRRNDILLKLIARKLVGLREKQGLSQQKVYIHTGIDMDMVERGEYNITLSTLADLCDYYNTSLEDFFKDMPNP